MSEEFFESEQDVSKLQAQLEAQLKQDQMSLHSRNKSMSAASGQLQPHPIQANQSSQDNTRTYSNDAVELVTRSEFGQLAASVAALHKRSKQRELLETRARTELQTAYGKEAARKVVETREFAATQKHVLKLNDELRGLQNLVIRQNSEIKRLEAESPRNRLLLTGQRIKFLLANLAKRSERVTNMTNHSNKIDSILKAKSDNLVLTRSLRLQKQKLRVLIAKQKLAISHERKALRSQQLIFQVQKLPHIGQALAPLQLKAEIKGLRANQQRLSEMVYDLQKNGTDELQNLHELQREIHESFRQLKTRIELQEDVLRATSVVSNAANEQQAANDDTGNEISGSTLSRHASVKLAAPDPLQNASRPKLVEPKKSRRTLTP